MTLLDCLASNIRKENAQQKKYLEFHFFLSSERALDAKDIEVQ